MTALGYLSRGRRDQTIGRNAEDAARLCGVGGWVTNARAATSDEDRRGIDVVFTTPLGDVPIQVKSSERGRDKHRAHSDIPCVVIYPHDSQWRIQRKVRAACAKYLRINHVSKLPHGWSVEDVIITWEQGGRRHG